MPSITDVFSNRTQYTLQLTVTQGTQEINNNRTSVSWTLSIIETTEWGSWTNGSLTWSVNVGGQTASGSDSYDFRNYDSLVLGSGSFWITHNSDGTKSIAYSASAGGGTTIGSASASSSSNFVLTTIPRASTPTYSPSPVEAGATVTITTNRASSSFTHDITYSIGSASGTIATGVGASTTWVVPTSLINQLPNAAQGNISITTVTKSGSTTIGTKTNNMVMSVPASIVPDFTTITHSEGTTGVAANVGAYVQKISKLVLAITGAVGANGSTISSYSIKIKNALGTVLQTITSASATSAVVDAFGTITIEGTVTDSRGRTKTKTVTVTFLAWAPPALAAVSVARALSGGTVDDNGTFVRVNINASVSSLMNTTERNAIVYKISSRLKGTSTWTLKKTVTPGGTSFNSFDTVSTYPVNEAHDILVEVLDDFATSAVQFTIATATIFMHLGNASAGEGVGFGKYWQYGALDVKGVMYQNDKPNYTYVQTLYLTSSTTFTKASYPWLAAVRVRLVGGGAGGGGSVAAPSGQHSNGGGGGGGGYAEKFILVSALATSETVTVGAGGSSPVGADGGDGGASSFGTLVAAGGGNGGQAGGTSALFVGGNAGGGGVGTAGDLLLPGSTGDVGVGHGTIGIAGHGGDSQLGAGGRSEYTGAGSGYSVGFAGKLYGGGGSGGSSNAGAAAHSGSDGAAGIVIVELYA